ncbi:hypothetical protein BC830DRAFT_1076512 [Chytriomyces sp. MP71]|nr:hypothetical protein BC830DRAFT_1076512 [Chytriomyces sp. MP71]
MAFSGRPSFRPREFKGPCGRINILNDEVDADSLSPTLTAVSPRIPLPPFIVPSSHQSSRLQYPPGLGRPIRQSPVHPTNAQPNIQTLLPSPVLSTKESRGDSDSRASSLEASEASSSSWHRNKRTPFKCSWEGCDKVFRESYNLKSHFFLHANVRPFKCQYCEASLIASLEGDEWSEVVK